MQLVLRNYQEKAVNMVRDEIRKGSKRVLLVMPTASGKTHTMGDIASKSITNGHKILAAMHRRQLVMQMVDRFADCGITAGVIMSGIESELCHKCQVTTVQTYLRRLKLSDTEINRFFINASVVFIDEAHHVLAKTYQKILKYYQDKIVIGVTATPCLSSGEGLGKYFDAIVQPVSIKELVDNKYLVPAIYYGPSEPDLSKLKTVAGDYEKKGLGEVMTKPTLIGDVVDNWLKIAGDKKTLCFSVNVAHSKALKDDFISKGVTAQHLDAFSDDETREATLNKFRSGEIQVLLNVGLYVEGSDIPEIECLCIARPTKSLGLHLQLLGRGARPFPGKDNFIVLDFGGNVARLGYYEDEIIWGLDDKDVAAKKKPRKKEKKIRTCEYCTSLFTGPVCPRCGLKIKEYKKLIETEEAELVQLGKPKKKEFTMEEKLRFMRMAEYHRRDRGYAEGWSSHLFRSKFSVWPNRFKGVSPLEPDYSFKNYLTYRNIQYHKSKNQAAA